MGVRLPPPDFITPVGLAVDGSGNLYIADQSNHRIRQVNPAGTIAIVAGTGIQGYNGDGIAATSAQLYFPSGVTVDGSGNRYIAEQSNNRIRKVNTSGIITTVAGSTSAGFSGDGGSATAAQLNNPTSVAVDGAGHLYLADYNNHRIRVINCVSMYTLKAGSWSDVSVWSCGRVPSVSDATLLRHAVTLPVSYVGQALRLIYSGTGRLLLNGSSRLKLGVN